MVASVGFTRPSGTAAFRRGVDLPVLMLMLLVGASQVVARPISQLNDNDTKIHMCYANVFMPAADCNSTVAPLVAHRLAGRRCVVPRCVRARPGGCLAL